MKSSYLIKRFGVAILTIYVVITVSFALIRLMPGGPMAYLRAQLMRQQGDVDPEYIARLVEIYTRVNPEKPLWEQYLDYMTSIFTGNFGVSMWYSEPVLEVLLRGMPWTIYYMSVSLALMFGIGISLGAAMAYKEGSRFDVIHSMLATFFNSVPYYIAAVVFLFFLSYQFSYFPTGGRTSIEGQGGITLSHFLDILYHSALPIVSLVLTAYGGWALQMRGNSIRVLGSDYLRVAELRGLPTKTIAISYVARNAILPMYTNLMIAVGYLFGGTIILEEIFNYPGLGYYIFRSIEARDYPLMMGGFILITIAVVIAVLIADLTYGIIDPRADSKEEGQ